jgi:hypothetical protein
MLQAYPCAEGNEEGAASRSKNPPGIFDGCCILEVSRRRRPLVPPAETVRARAPVESSRVEQAPAPLGGGSQLREDGPTATRRCRRLVPALSRVRAVLLAT